MTLRPVPKEPKPWRSKPYLEFIDSQFCTVPGCIFPATHHHQPRRGECNRPKVGDDRCLPLCGHLGGHHVDGNNPRLPGSYHGMGKITGWSFWEFYGIDVEFEINRLQSLYVERGGEMGK